MIFLFINSSLYNPSLSLFFSIFYIFSSYLISIYLLKLAVSICLYIKLFCQSIFNNSILFFFLSWSALYTLPYFHGWKIGLWTVLQVLLQGWWIYCFWFWPSLVLLLISSAPSSVCYSPALSWISEYPYFLFLLLIRFRIAVLTELTEWIDIERSIILFLCI